MEKLNKHDNKILVFATQLMNAYRDEEDIEYVQKLEFEEDELTDDFIAMLQAIKIHYTRITGEETDIIGITHILNRLAFQHLLDKSEVKEGK